MNGVFFYKSSWSYMVFAMQSRFVNASYFQMTPTVQRMIRKLCDRTGFSVLLIVVSPCLDQFLVYIRC